jgi:hypothetical protein
MQQEEVAAKRKPFPRDGEDTTCLYPSKRCENPRVVKSNGQLHKFCQDHRDKANFNQRRLEFKRRSQQEQLEPAGADSETPIQVKGRPLLPKPATIENEDGSDDSFELDEEHIRIIEEVASASIVDGASLDNQLL